VNKEYKSNELKRPNKTNRAASHKMGSYVKLKSKQNNYSIFYYTFLISKFLKFKINIYISRYFVLYFDTIYTIII